MSNYVSAFLTPYLLAWLGALLVFAAGLTWWLRGKFRRGRQVLFFLLVLSTGLVVLVTLLREPPAGLCLSCFGNWGLARVLTGTVGTDVLLNVVLFVPPAFLTTLLWRAPWLTIGIAALVSLAIEVIQPVLGLGANDAIDLLANTAGGAIGAAAAALLLLVFDSIRDRRIDLGRTARVAGSLTIGAAVLIGGPAWAANTLQAATSAQLLQLFEGTTLADYQANRNTTWEAKLAQVHADARTPTVIGRSDDAVARERYTWNVYFAVRCVIAEWTPTGFTTIQLSGPTCTEPLELRP